MVLSSLAPLFLLMGVRGNHLFPDLYFVTTCLALAVLPSLFLFWRIRLVRRIDDTRVLTTGKPGAGKPGPGSPGAGSPGAGSPDTALTQARLVPVALAYLFVIMLPFYGEKIETYQDLVAMIVMIGIVVFFFWRMNLHYLNLCFEVLGYRVFVVQSPGDEKAPYNRPACNRPAWGRLENFAILTRRKRLPKGEEVIAYRLSNTVYMEKQG